MSKSPVVKPIAIVLVFAIVGWLVWASIGANYSGKAERPEDIPLIGKNLAELQFHELANYKILEHPHGGGTAYLDAKVAADSLTHLCETEGILIDADALNILPRSDLERQIVDDWPWSDKPKFDKTWRAFVGLTPRFLHFYGLYNEENGSLYCKIHFAGAK